MPLGKAQTIEERSRPGLQQKEMLRVCYVICSLGWDGKVAFFKGPLTRILISKINGQSIKKGEKMTYPDCWKWLLHNGLPD